MVLPGSMNMAPPPVQRRTTVNPDCCAWSRFTSSSSDWNLPMTTAGAAHSQKRKVGGILPAATRSARRISMSICSWGMRGVSWMTSGFSACQRARRRRSAFRSACSRVRCAWLDIVAAWLRDDAVSRIAVECSTAPPLPTARWNAMRNASASAPINWTCGWAENTALRSSPCRNASASAPNTTCCSDSSPSMKKSPSMLHEVMKPAGSHATVTPTSLPPGVLYSPRIGQILSPEARTPCRPYAIRYL